MPDLIQSVVAARAIVVSSDAPGTEDRLTIPIVLGAGLGIFALALAILYIVYRRKRAAQSFGFSAKSTRRLRAVVPTKQKLPLLPTVGWTSRETLSHKLDKDSESIKATDDWARAMAALVPSLDKAPSSPTPSLFAQPNVPLPAHTPSLSRCSTVSRKPVPALEVDDVDLDLECAICTRPYEAGEELRILDCAGEHQCESTLR